MKALLVALALAFVVPSLMAQAPTIIDVQEEIDDFRTQVETWVGTLGVALIMVATLWISIFVGHKKLKQLERELD